MNLAAVFDGIDAKDIALLPRDRRERLAELLATITRRNSQRQFFDLFPDNDNPQPDGRIIYARSRYPKHIEFFDAGARYRERCFLAANRCITPWTWLETPAGSVLSAEVWTSPDACVLSWDGGSECAAQAQRGMLKCIEPAFRLVTDTGLFFDCTRKHRVLTTEGWLSLDQLVRRASGLRLWHRHEDYQANCDEGGYLGDRPLRSLGGIDLASLQPTVDVRGRAPLLFELTDEAERRFQHSRTCPERDRLSTPDDLRRHAGLFALFSGASSDKCVLSLSGRTQAVLRLVAESGSHLRSAAALRHDQSASCEVPGLGQSGDLDIPYSQLVHDAARQSGALSCDVQGLGGSVQQWRRDDGRTAIFYPYEHIPLIGGQRVVAIVPLGLQPIIDAHVPNFLNYKAAGVYHHNTGKTTAGAFEVTAHLTGRYPDWWVGRRFAEPVSVWACGKRNESTRDVVQKALLGDVSFDTPDGRKGFKGTAMIPGHFMGRITWKRGVDDLVDTILVKHVSGGWSRLGLKAYEQGRGSFEGTAKHVIWLDEECPLDVYGECLIRTATTGGIILLTFTPVEGLTETVMQFIRQED